MQWDLESKQSKTHVNEKAEHGCMLNAAPVDRRSKCVRIKSASKESTQPHAKLERWNETQLYFLNVSNDGPPATLLCVFRAAQRVPLNSHT